MTTHVYVKNSFVGYHCWPEAPEEVSFLRNSHRHVFGVVSVVEVKHDDRQVEFFILQRHVDLILMRLRSELTRKIEGASSYSCEQMAKYIAGELTGMNYTVVSVAVNEDGENGAIYMPFDFKTEVLKLILSERRPGGVFCGP